MINIISQYKYFLLSMRPKQWIKNFIIFLPLIFSWEFFNFFFLFKAIFIFMLFSFFVWATYILNDLKDIKNDRRHPKKSKRPLASWKLNERFALFLSILIIFLILLFVFIKLWFIIFILFLLYFINTFLYSFYIKNIVILDVFFIAFWFVIRWLIWIFIINVEISYWFLINLFFWALFLGFLKRYQEVESNINTRKNIEKYNIDFLKQINSMLATCILISYSLYTFQSTQPHSMICTLPIVTFVIIRYCYNIFFENRYLDSIEDILIKDKWIVLSGIVYIVIVFFVLYF